MALVRIKLLRSAQDMMDDGARNQGGLDCTVSKVQLLEGYGRKWPV